MPKPLLQVRGWSREFGIRVGIHSHGGYHFGGQPSVLNHLVGLGAPEVGLCIDTAWAMQIGPHQGNPVKWAKDYAGHIYGVHYKDFVFGRDGMWEDVVVGEGNLDLKAFVSALEEGGFDGMAVITRPMWKRAVLMAWPLSAPEKPTWKTSLAASPALTKCVETMRAFYLPP